MAQGAEIKIVVSAPAADQLAKLIEATRATCDDGPAAHYRRRCVCDPDLLTHESGCWETL